MARHALLEGSSFLESSHDPGHAKLSEYIRQPADRWTSDPALIALLTLRHHERPGGTSGFWRGVRFAFLGVAPFYVLVIYMWLR
jgi:hypothetical protein